jgi:AraC-like DNA-binding protein
MSSAGRDRRGANTQMKPVGEYSPTRLEGNETERLFRNHVNSSCGTIPFRESTIDSRIAKALQIILSSSIQSNSVKSVAAVLNLSPSRMRDLFKEQVGMPFHKYEIMLRLERARTLLCTAKCSVEEAARIANFMDVSNFTKAFKRSYGVTPGRMKTGTLAKSNNDK